jgi:hypothetical protein
MCLLGHAPGMLLLPLLQLGERLQSAQRKFCRMFELPLHADVLLFSTACMARP